MTRDAILAQIKSSFRYMRGIKSVVDTVLARDQCTRLLTGIDVKMTVKKCSNYTIKEEMQGQLCKNWEKTITYISEIYLYGNRQNPFFLSHV